MVTKETSVFLMTLIGVVIFFVGLLIIAPALASNPAPAPTPTPPVSMDTFSKDGYTCAYLHRGPQAIHTDCFKVQTP